MRNFTLKNRALNNMDIKPHNIVAARTSTIDYEMDRQILLEDVDGLDYSQGEHFLLLDGSHCSCYDFDETDWNATAYTIDEIKSLALADYNQRDLFWQTVREYLGI